MNNAKYLLAIELKDTDHVWNRCVLSSFIPTLDDLYYYYAQLCGFDNVSIDIHHEQIPEEFNESLLTTLNTEPSNFPIHDLQTELKNDEKRTQYKQYIVQLCEMERTRAKLQVFAKKKDTESTDTNTFQNSRIDSEKRAWVKELLRSLNLDYDYEDSHEIVSIDQDTCVPLGWIITPTVSKIRSTKGSRFLLDPSLGKKWESLLGTDLYPDFVVSRRISTAHWAFQDPISTTLLKTTLDWYLASQDASVNNGLSDWIRDADSEINTLFASFRKIKVHEKFLNIGDSQNKVFKILSILESRHLASSMEETVHPISSDLFLRYVNYVCLHSNIPKEQYWGLETVRQILLRWERSKLGFKPDVNPFIDSWSETWRLVMQGAPTTDKVTFFLQTLDVWDPLESILISNTQRIKIAKEWISIFLQTQIIKDSTASIRSAIVHETITKWCYRFLPEKLFVTNITPSAIGPILTKHGYITTKLKGGRWTAGFVFRDTPIMFQVPEKEPKNEKRTDGEDEDKDNEKNVLHHFFPDEDIHLGTV